MPETMLSYPQAENSSRLWQPKQKLYQKQRGRSMLDYKKNERTRYLNLTTDRVAEVA